MTQNPIVSIEGASKWYPSGSNKVFCALDNVSIAVAEKEVVVLLGPSGSGKSTLLRCVNLLTVPDEGKVTVGNSTWTANEKTSAGQEKAKLLKIRRDVGMVFQHFNLFPHMTAAQNIMCGLTLTRGMSKVEAREIAEEVLGKVGLANRADYHPSQLSGGQKQRVAIARAIATKPIAMLFDEPTSALDPELRGSVLSVMQDLAAEGMTMIVVTHEMGFARAVGDRVIFMEHGKIIEEAEAREFLDNPKTDRAQAFLSQI